MATDPLVEAGRVKFRASGEITVIRSAIAEGPAPTATATIAPTPTRASSPTTDVLLNPGDGAPVPLWTMHSLRNEGSEPAVILDVRVVPDGMRSFTDGLDIETLAEETGVTGFPASRLAFAVGMATIAAGGLLLAPPAEKYELVAASHDARRLERAPDGALHNTGTAPVDVYVASVSRVGDAGALQPPQPAAGPGGSNVLFDRVVSNHYGAAEQGYYLFEPAGPLPGAGPAAEAPLPVVLFIGGCCETHAEPFLLSPPGEVQSWIDHLTQRGAIVIYPIVRANHVLDDLTATMQAATAELSNGAHAAPDWSRFTAIGFSFGGWWAPVFAAHAAANGEPTPGAIFSTVAYDPGTNPDLSALPASTHIVILVGKEDFEWADRGSRRLWAAMTTIPEDQRAFVRLHTDGHGYPFLAGDHAVPSTQIFGTTNAYDWYGVWRLGDALMSCAFAAEACEYAFGDTPEQRFMGYWSDGVPVTELEVIRDPAPPDPATPTT